MNALRFSKAHGLRETEGESEERKKRSISTATVALWPILVIFITKSREITIANVSVKVPGDVDPIPPGEGDSSSDDDYHEILCYKV